MPSPTVVVTRVLDVGQGLVPRKHPEAAHPPPQPAAKRPSVVPPPPRAPAMPGQSRPRLPNITSSAPGDSLWDSVEALLDDVDAGFGAITGETPPQTLRDPAPGAPKVPATGATHGEALAPARELFTQLAATHVRHVRDFMIDVKAGSATTEWLSLCIPSIDGVRRMAEQFEIADLVKALETYLAALKDAAAATGFSIDGPVRDRLLATYAPLVALLPSAFALDAVKSRREGIIVQSLLMQVPGVRKVTIDKIYAAGLTTLDSFYVAKPEEIAQTTGIDRTLAELLSERFRRYKAEVQAAVPDDSRSSEHSRLETLAKALATQHTGFERAEKDDDGPRKRELRKARDATFLEIKVLMARVGEVELLGRVEKLPFGLKLTEIERYLDEAKNRPRTA